MLQIYNSASQAKEVFKPIIPGKIGLYVCGVTVYDYCHLGHARVFVAFDAIVRFLRYQGWQVTFVRNITDIDDKIIQRAKLDNQAITPFTNYFIQAMHDDMQQLKVLPVDHEPRATDYMAHMITLIERLMERKLAYQADNQDIYFSVENFQGYGQLSHRALDKLQAGARVEVSNTKRNELDFVLWKQAKSNEPAWDSPWGPGRPGWHIECSAMAIDCLGETFDLHGGGADLLFPHHENERAQSSGATQKSFANYWLHVGFVQVNHEKMSKSLNNFFTIRELLTQYEPEVVRFFLLNSHYRSPLNYTDDSLAQAKNALSRLYTALRQVEIDTQLDFKQESYYHQFIQAMQDDFNTPNALATLFDIASTLNTAKTTQGPIIYWASLLKKLGNVLGLLETDPNLFLQGETNSQIEELIAQRQLARANRDWVQADNVRQALTKLGVVVEDTPQGPIWRKL